MFMKVLTLNDAEYGDGACYDVLQTGLLSKNLIVVPPCNCSDKK